MIREIISEEKCKECGRTIIHSEEVYECDSCGKEIDFKVDDPNNDDSYLKLNIAYSKGEKHEAKIFCSWKCCIKFLKSFSFTEDVWYISLPFLLNERGEFCKFQQELKK